MKSFIVVDLETTGLQPEQDHIIEIGALKYVDGVCVGEFSRLVKPPVSISNRISQITGIDDEMVENAPGIKTVMEEFLLFAGEEACFLGHNVRFDLSFLKVQMLQMKRSFPVKSLDTLVLARKFLKELPKKDLQTVSTYYGIVNERAHRALEDAKTTALVYFSIKKQFGEQEPEAFVPKEIQLKVKKAEPITWKQKNYLIDLLKYHKIQGETIFGEGDKEIDALTKSEASKIIDRIILSYGKINR